MSQSANQSENDLLQETHKQLFIEIVKQITTQQLDTLLEEMFQYVINYSAEQAFRQCHPESSWIMDKIKYVFCTHTRFLLDIYNESMNPSEPISAKERRQLVRSSLDRINLQVTTALKNETAGLDYELIVALAGENYESKENAGLSVVILPDCDHSHFEQTGAFRFEEGSGQRELIYSEVHAIRKQLNLAGTGALAIAKDYDKEKFVTLGILPESSLVRYPSLTFKKGLTWEYYLPYEIEEIDEKHVENQPPQQEAETVESAHEQETQAASELAHPQKLTTKRRCVLRYCRGTFMLPILNLENEITKEMLKIIVNANISDTDANEWCKKMARVVLYADECKHGAVIIFLHHDIIEEEISRLIDNFNRGMKLPVPLPLFDSPGIITQLANIDGALLVDEFGICHAYGVILDGVPQKNGETGRGARYNSTKAYIEHKMKEDQDSLIIGVVKSEDGMLDIFPEKHDSKI